MIRVGRIQSASDKLTYSGFIPIVVMMKSSPYYSLSPYSLTLELKINEKKQRCNLENIWQFSKVYETVPASKQTYSRFDRTVIWEWPAQTHVIKNKDETIELTPEYYEWRRAGFVNEAVRYPVGFKHRSQCIGSLKDEDDEQLLDYIDARKQIYVPNYLKAVQNLPSSESSNNKTKTNQFKQLQQMLKEGKNLLIVEVDGPHQESLDYYKKKYHVKDDFIEDNTILATKENLKIMLNDVKHAFGHGYCLAMALLDINLD